MEIAFRNSLTKMNLRIQKLKNSIFLLLITTTLSINSCSVFPLTKVVGSPQPLSEFFAEFYVANIVSAIYESELSLIENVKPKSNSNNINKFIARVNKNKTVITSPYTFVLQINTNNKEYIENIIIDDVVLNKVQWNNLFIGNLTKSSITSSWDRKLKPVTIYINENIFINSKTNATKTANSFEAELEKKIRAATRNFKFKIIRINN